MKKILILVSATIAIIVIAFVYFYLNRKSEPEDLISYLKALKSYSCDISMKVKNDKQEVSYNCRQIYSIGLGYRLELEKDRIMIYREDKIFIKDSNSEKKYTTDKSFDDVFRLSFLGEYIGMLYTNEEIKYSYKKIDGEEFSIVRLKIPNNNRNLSYAELYINKKEKAPYKLFIYDENGNEKIDIQYKNFLPNVELSKDMFSM